MPAIDSTLADPDDQALLTAMALDDSVVPGRTLAQGDGGTTELAARREPRPGEPGLLVRKRVRESKLDAYPTMTPRRKELLLARFHTVPGIRSRSPEELAELPGISLKWAQGFCAWLKGTSAE